MHSYYKNPMKPSATYWAGPRSNYNSTFYIKKKKNRFKHSPRRWERKITNHNLFIFPFKYNPRYWKIRSWSHYVPPAPTAICTQMRVLGTVSKGSCCELGTRARRWLHRPLFFFTVYDI